MRKTVRELTKFARLHHSLGGKTFRAILLLSLVLGIASIAFGFFLYSYAVNREYRSKTQNLANTAAMVLDLPSIRTKSTEVLSIYDSLSEEEKKDPETDEYRAKFHYVSDMEHNKIRWDVHELHVVNDAVAGYVAALDLENNRMIFIADGDQTSTYCPPGYFDEMKAKDLDVLVNGNKLSILDRLNGTESMHAVITRMDRYGYRCTAGEKLFQYKDYPVYIFYDTDMTKAAAAARTFLWQYVLIVFVIAVLIGIFIIHHIRKQVVDPINELADAANAYASDKHRASNRGRYFEQLDIHTGDEIENLSLTMKDMEREAVDYMNNLTRITAEKERISTELDVASQIQEGMIPHTYPAFPERQEFDLYATMDTAKEVGGDFYDFFLVDEDHLALVIADVSGKGIPAALFMMASKIMIKNYAVMMKDSPAKILQEVNNQICSNNTMEMFVTVWLAIVELSTGKVVASNAGHEYPIIKRAGKKYELMKDRHGLVVGAIDGFPYADYHFQLESGDCLFQYTDGVTEATNPAQELFGLERTLDALNEYLEANPEMVLIHVREAIDDFVAEAPQFDDITMLCFAYHGPERT